MSIKKIAIVGPESTGKSALSQALAKHFSCHWVPEYARAYCEKLSGPCTIQDEVNMFNGQIQLEDSILEKSILEKKKFLFCDTMILSVKIWTEAVLKMPTPFVLQELESRKYDLFLLCDIDLPWVKDSLREFPNKRNYFLSTWKKELKKCGFSFHIVRGFNQARIDMAIGIIEESMNSK